MPPDSFNMALDLIGYAALIATVFSLAFYFVIFRRNDGTHMWGASMACVAIGFGYIRQLLEAWGHLSGDASLLARLDNLNGAWFFAFAAIAGIGQFWYVVRRIEVQKKRSLEQIALSGKEAPEYG